MLQPKSFYYIRHGETNWNLDNRCMGQQDVPLNLVGIKQAESARELLFNTQIETICYSPLSRSKQTAEIINQSFGCPLVSIENLKECNWGILEGQIKQDVDFIRWVNGKTPSAAETYINFLKRTRDALHDALSYPTPLIVGHGGVYWAILKALGNDQNHFSAPPNGIPIYHRPLIRNNEPWLIISLDEKNANSNTNTTLSPSSNLNHSNPPSTQSKAQFTQPTCSSNSSTATKKQKASFHSHGNWLSLNKPKSQERRLFCSNSSPIPLFGFRNHAASYNTFNHNCMSFKYRTEVQYQNMRYLSKLFLRR